MDTTMNDTQSNGLGKKEMKKQLADKIAAAIPELKAALGDKKFDHRIKKAVKFITEGLHKKETAGTVKKLAAEAGQTEESALPKKRGPKKGSTRKVSAKKASPKAAKVTTKKAKAAKKASVKK